jgi:hypothetical protein
MTFQTHTFYQIYHRKNVTLATFQLLTLTTLSYKWRDVIYNGHDCGARIFWTKQTPPLDNHIHGEQSN